MRPHQEEPSNTEGQRADRQFFVQAEPRIIAQRQRERRRHGRRILLRVGIYVSTAIAYTVWQMRDWTTLCLPPWDPTGCRTVAPGGFVQELQAFAGLCAVLLVIAGLFKLSDTFRNRAHRQQHRTQP